MLPFAEQGNVDAQFYIASMYDDGIGVLESDKAAAKWYTLAAKQGHVDAQFNLGIMYDEGNGVPESQNRALEWYTLAAKQGHVDAQFNLGNMYIMEGSIFKDYILAYMWWNLSAYNGNNLAITFKNFLARELTPVQIEKAQDMSIRCLESNYKDC